MIERLDIKVLRHKEVTLEVDRYELLLRSGDDSNYSKMQKAESETTKYIKSVAEKINDLREKGKAIVSDLRQLRNAFVNSSDFLLEDFSEYFSFINGWSMEVAEMMAFSAVPRFSDSDQRRKWLSKLEDEKTAYEKLVRESGQESLDMLLPKLNALRTERDKLSKEIDNDKLEIAKIHNIERRIISKLEDLSTIRGNIRVKRLENISNINSMTPINIFVKYNESTDEYRDFLDEILKSKGLSDKGGTISKLLSLSSAELASLCLSNDINAIKNLGLSESNALVVISVVKSKNGLSCFKYAPILSPRYGLEKVSVKFSVEQLSIGERVSAVFPLLTINAGLPIILDQPEGDLDHGYIIENIVGTIRDSKLRQQYIIVTHNPNIPVLADADQVIKVVRNESDRHCCVDKQGGLENKDVNDMIAQLEGGLKAIELRFNRYKR